jgi:hypothetical protein
MAVRLRVGRRTGPVYLGASAPLPAPRLPTTRGGQRAAAVLFVGLTALGCLALALLLF